MSVNPVISTRSQPVESGMAGLWRRWGGVVLGAVALALLMGLVWYLLKDTASQKRQVADAPMLMLPPPPPPPPEPEKLPEPEPEPIKPQMVEPEITPVEPLEPRKDDAPPSPSPDLGDPVTMNSDAQAGTDAFGIGAGRGGGSVGGGAGGGGLGSASYFRYVGSMLSRELARHPRTRHLAFDDIQIDLWLDAAGKVTRVQRVKGTGAEATDEAVLAMVRELGRIDEAPPAAQRMPLRISMKGQRQ